MALERFRPAGAYLVTDSDSSVEMDCLSDNVIKPEAAPAAKSEGCQPNHIGLGLRLGLGLGYGLGRM